MSDYHTSVLFEEAIASLRVEAGEKYIDATLGGGGHTTKIIQQGGVVLGIDVDSDAIAYVSSRVKENAVLVQKNFRKITEIAKDTGFNQVAGILFDLGVSSNQFDKAEKGFSFQKDAALDMRMDQQLGVTAADLVNALAKDALLQLVVQYGEEQYAGRIVRAILDARKIKKIATTKELSDIIVKVYPKKTPHKGDAKGGIHPATKVFQALRIAVNDELASLKEALEGAVLLLKPEGRLVVISFHSLEDRIVKNTFLSFAEQEQGKIITKKPIIPTYEEISTNNRSRSAKMRVFEKTA